MSTRHQHRHAKGPSAGCSSVEIPSNYRCLGHGQLLAGCTFLIVFFVVGSGSAEARTAHFLIENVEMRQQYYKTMCILKFVERGVRVDSTEAHLNCTINADAYKAQLDARSR
jgi:hypothetical protein